MLWLSLTIADLPAAKASALVDAMGTAALGTGQVNPLPEILANVVARIRTEIAAGGRTVLDVDATKIPPSLKSLALRMVLREGQSRLNAAGALPLSDDEREEWRQDVRYLERIAKGEISVELSDTPQSTSPVQAATPSPRITPRDRQFTRATQDGC
jgi:hypothetical protein